LQAIGFEQLANMDEEEFARTISRFSETGVLPMGGNLGG
jgi:hypothetical protein